jgi:hypothetical protein
MSVSTLQSTTISTKAAISIAAKPSKRTAQLALAEWRQLAA